MSSSTATLANFGIVGLGKMGGNLARQALAKKFRVAGFTQGGPAADLKQAGLVVANNLGELAAALETPRLVFLYIPAGEAVDRTLDELAGILSAGDIVADGGNSYWGDSMRRHAAMRRRGVHFVDLGTSGGPLGALEGACFMAGGDAETVAKLEPILRKLAVEGGFVYAGPPGSGHFVKLVHNGIEFGMLQAIGEGIDLLERYRHRLPIADVLECWRHGSVVRSWLIDLMTKSYRERGGLGDVPGYVSDTGEVNWLVDDALHMDAPIPVITQAVMQLVASRDGHKNWARAIALMRRGFGGHPFGEDPTVQRERRTGRVGGFPPEDKP
ncbi:MAG TPA: decarboxylating 6-phosphogluconate dehydrogenase [Reyranella sp.]|jgi:6-phosphogluconate dehydrogenase|nr:decarboxylating 6-phosphogluconate dehydrogenase [Reyranella sp.]